MIKHVIADLTVVAAQPRILCRTNRKDREDDIKIKLKNGYLIKIVKNGYLQKILSGV